MVWTPLPGKLMSKDCAKPVGGPTTGQSICLKRVRECFDTQGVGLFCITGNNFPTKINVKRHAFYK
jgi:hypothetical protein